MNKILLTGATGFLGRAILKLLLNAGHQVRVPVREGKEHLLPDHPLLEVNVIEDLFALPDKDLDILLGGVDLLVHAAWYTVPADCLESEKNIDCLTGTCKLARAFVRNRGRRFIALGTFFEYDQSYGYLRTTTALNPTTLYARCKAAAAAVLEQYFSQMRCEFMWLRVFSLYGITPDCGERTPRLAPYIHQQLGRGETAELSGGRQVRDYLEVNDAAGRIVELSLSQHTGYANICSGQGMTIRELAEKIADIYGRRDLLHFNPASYRPNETMYVVGEPYDKL